MGQNQWAPVRRHDPLISHNLQKKSLLVLFQECHAPCKRNLGPNRIRLASPTTQWLSYDSLDVQCNHQGSILSYLRIKSARSIFWRWCSLMIWQMSSTSADRVDAAMKKKTDGWLKKIQKINLTGGRGRGRHEKTWTGVIYMGCLAPGLTETHTYDRGASSGRLRSAVRLDILWIK